MTNRLPIPKERHQWTARLFNSLGCELATVATVSRERMNAMMAEWTLANGDSIKIEGPEEEVI